MEDKSRGTRTNNDTQQKDLKTVLIEPRTSGTSIVVNSSPLQLHRSLNKSAAAETPCDSSQQQGTQLNSKSPVLLEKNKILPKYCLGSENVSPYVIMAGLAPFWEDFGSQRNFRTAEQVPSITGWHSSSSHDSQKHNTDSYHSD